METPSKVRELKPNTKTAVQGEVKSQQRYMIQRAAHHHLLQSDNCLQTNQRQVDDLAEVTFA